MLLLRRRGNERIISMANELEKARSERYEKQIFLGGHFAVKIIFHKRESMQWK